MDDAQMTHRIIVTGADGQLGRALRPLLPGAVFLDRAALDLTANPNYIRDRLIKLEPDAIVNCAAYTKVDRAESNWNTAYKVNAEAAAAMALACAEILPQGLPLIQISTDYVYGPLLEWQRCHREDQVPHPESAYGWTKLAGEQLALSLNPQTTVIRTSWLYGDGHNFVRSILSQARAHLDALELGQVPAELRVVDDQIGRPTYAPDLAAFVAWLVKNQPRPPSRIYNFSNGGPPVSWADFASEILHLAELPVTVARISTAEATARGPVAPRPAVSTLDLTRVSQLYGPPRPWREALAEFVKPLL